MHCLYFICERNCYALTHVKITRQWKSALIERRKEVRDDSGRVLFSLDLNAEGDLKIRLKETSRKVKFR